MSNRQQVEAYWKKVYVDVDVDKTALVMAEAQKPICLCNEEGEPSEALAWAAALAFTEEHKEKARQLERQIFEQECEMGSGEDWLRWCVDGPYVPEDLVSPAIRTYATQCRTLAILESALAQHMIGVKE